MILTKMSKLGESGMYSYLDAFNLSDYRIEKPGGRRTLGREHRYTLLLARKSQSTAYTLYMKTEAECDMWFRALQNAMYVLLFHSHKIPRISILIHSILQFKFSTHLKFPHKTFLTGITSNQLDVGIRITNSS